MMLDLLTHGSYTVQQAATPVDVTMLERELEGTRTELLEAQTRLEQAAEELQRLRDAQLSAAPPHQRQAQAPEGARGGTEADAAQAAAQPATSAAALEVADLQAALAAAEAAAARAEVSSMQGVMVVCWREKGGEALTSMVMHKGPLLFARKHRQVHVYARIHAQGSFPLADLARPIPLTIQ
jgi:hypothetical protein